MDAPGDFPNDSFHTALPKMMPLNAIDPSLFLGFFCRSSADFQQWIADSEHLSGADTDEGQLFSVHDVLPEEVGHALGDASELVMM